MQTLRTLLALVFTLCCLAQAKAICDRVESTPHPPSPFQGEEEFAVAFPPLGKGRDREGIIGMQENQACINLITICAKAVQMGFTQIP